MQESRNQDRVRLVHLLQDASLWQLFPILMLSRWQYMYPGLLVLPTSRRHWLHSWCVSKSVSKEGLTPGWIESCFSYRYILTLSQSCTMLSLSLFCGYLLLSKSICHLTMPGRCVVFYQEGPEVLS